VPMSGAMFIRVTFGPLGLDRGQTNGEEEMVLVDGQDAGR
jgi:hypothetical protein